MVGTCEVCSSAPSKYRCPTCGLMRYNPRLNRNRVSLRYQAANSVWGSCSLPCTQSHRIYCAPKPSPSQALDSSAAASDAHPESQNEAGAQQTQTPPAGEKHGKAKASTTPASLAASPAVKDLLLRYPQLRSQLQDVYQLTLEEEWVEWHAPAPRGRYSARGGRALSRRSRGPWTAEKGFNRGLGKVRKLRQQCEEGLETGPAAEAFMQFMALVNESQSGVSK